MESAIQIEGLGKLYRISGGAPETGSLREDLTRWFRNIIRPGSTGRHGNLNGARSQDDSQLGNFWALRGVNLTIAPGEVVGVVGRNGAGKSTLLKILARITPPTEGKVRYRGRVGSLLEIGTGFHRELTGRENIFLNGSILGMRRDEVATKLDEIVAFAEVDKFIDAPVKFYSSGMSRATGFRGRGSPRYGHSTGGRSAGRRRRTISEKMPGQDGECGEVGRAHGDICEPQHECRATVVFAGRFPARRSHPLQWNCGRGGECLSFRLQLALGRIRRLD